MHGAPSVSYPVGRSLLARALAGLLWLAGAAVLAAWLLAADEPGWRHALAGAALAGSGIGAVIGLRRSPGGLLAWGGESWAWHGAGEPEAGTPGVALDLQRWLLLHWRGSGGVRWLWASRDAAPSDWEALRRAVYSRATTGAPPVRTP